MNWRLFVHHARSFILRELGRWVFIFLPFAILLVLAIRLSTGEWVPLHTLAAIPAAILGGAYLPRAITDYRKSPVPFRPGLSRRGG